MESEDSGYEGSGYEAPSADSVSGSNNARQRRIQIAAIVMCVLMALPILGLLVAQLLS